MLNTGHLHPKIKAAIAAQLERFTHTCFQVTPYESYIELAEQLNAIAPGKTPKKTIFLTTGAEAIENAVYTSTRFIPDRFLPDKAIDLIDEAGARVKLR